MLETEKLIRCSLLSAIFYLFLFVLCCQAAQAATRLSGMFSDHMVLQANQPIKVWGTATPRELVAVQIGDKKGLATTDARGHWLATLAPLSVGGPFDLHVVGGGGDRIVVHDVMVGEVWVCAGQANMAMSVDQAKLGIEAETAPYDSSIRMISLPQKLAEEPIASTAADASKTIDSKWQVFDDKAKGHAAPAVPFLFALELRKKIKGPIGLIVACAPGATIQSWVSARGLMNSRPGRSLLNDLPAQFSRYKKAMEKVKQDEAKREAKSTGKSKDLLQLEAWTIEDVNALKFGRNPPFLPPPTAVFNGMISAVAPFSVKGVLFFHGETNVGTPDDYEALFTAMMADWRVAWSHTQMPFLFVQFPPVGARQQFPSAISNAATLREQQYRASLAPWTYMASSVDSVNQDAVGWIDSDKKLIARRLAQIALATQYNQPCAIKGPTFDSLSVDGIKVKVKFKNATHGLKMIGPNPIGFAIAGDDKKYFWAKAEIEGDTISVWHFAVKQPAAIVYGWADNPNGNVYNGRDWPAVPFKAEIKPATR